MRPKKTYVTLTNMSVHYRRTLLSTSNLTSHATSKTLLEHTNQLLLVKSSNCVTVEGPTLEHYDSPSPVADPP